MKECKDCGESKPKNDFYKKEGFYIGQCKECTKAYMREYANKRKKAKEGTKWF